MSTYNVFPNNLIPSNSSSQIQTVKKQQKHFEMSKSPESRNSPSTSEQPAPSPNMVGPGWTCCRCGAVTSLKWLDCEDRQCRHRRCNTGGCRINKGPGFLRKIASTLKARATKE